MRKEKNMIKINQAEERKEEGIVGARGDKDPWDPLGRASAAHSGKTRA